MLPELQRDVKYATSILFITDSRSAQPLVIMVVPYCEHNVHTRARLLSLNESGGSSLRATKDVKHHAKSISRMY